MKIILFVEGSTEAKTLPAFLKRWLDPRLNKPVAIQAVDFDGAGELIAESPKRIQKYLNGPRRDVIAVVALLDFQGAPLSYPAALTKAAERMVWAKQDLEARTDSLRFRQFFAVHELEAWLLSDITIFPKELQDAFPVKISQPEAVNSHEPPSALLGRLYQSRMRKPYKKGTDGEKLFAKLNPEIAYQKCRSLQMLLDEMLALAQAG